MDNTVITYSATSAPVSANGPGTVIYTAPNHHASLMTCTDPAPVYFPPCPEACPSVCSSVNQSSLFSKIWVWVLVFAVIVLAVAAFYFERDGQLRSGTKTPLWVWILFGFGALLFAAAFALYIWDYTRERNRRRALGKQPRSSCGPPPTYGPPPSYSLVPSCPVGPTPSYCSPVCSPVPVPNSPNGAGLGTATDVRNVVIRDCPQPTQVNTSFVNYSRAQLPSNYPQPTSRVQSSANSIQTTYYPLPSHGQSQSTDPPRHSSRASYGDNGPSALAQQLTEARLSPPLNLPQPQYSAAVFTQGVPSNYSVSRPTEQPPSMVI